MAHPEERKLVLRFCVTTVGLLGCVFAWVCVLSFNAADPPSDSVWTAAPHIANRCGAVGAWIAFYLFYYLGVSTYALLGLLTLLVLACARGMRLRDLWFRLVGLSLTCGAISIWATMLLSTSDRYLLTGPGGVVGAAGAPFFRAHFQILGTHIVLSCILLVGLILAADELILRLFRGAQTTGRLSIPVLARGGAALASAGGAVAAGVASLPARFGNNGGRRAATTPPKPHQRPIVDHDPEADEDAEEPESTPPEEALPPPSPVRRFTLEPRPEPKPAPERTPEAKVKPESPATAAASTNSPPEVPDSDDLPLIDTRPARFVPEAIVPPPRTDPLPTPPAPAPTVASLEPVAAQPPDPKPASVAIAAPAPAATTSAVTPPVPVVAKTAPRPAATKESAPRPVHPDADDYQLPSIELLEHAPPINKEASEILCREKAYILEQTLNEFRVTVQVVAIETGPVITVFELKLAPGVKVSHVASLSNDMARALKAPAVRVVAPLPGKNTIGIEVPNTDKEKVRLRDVMELFGRRADGHAIPLFLGKDASGQPLVSDLTRMPHLLIAGTTGSGKSVCVSSMILSILLTRSPSDVNLILVDPKMVELAAYREIPHLMCPIITDTTKAESILDWAATMMDERYALLAEAGVRDIRSYNRLGREALKERLKVTSDEELGRTPVHLPYVVIIIDELADLMMTSAREVEFYLCRLAQKSRAVGIHLIVSTQRPQANVVTGLIKSNLPCRIAFRVSSRLDSRIVLDQNGGETLMGQGDMLFLPPGSSKLIRAQGTFVSDDELRRVVSRTKEQRSPNYHPELVRTAKTDGNGSTERDELFDQAVEAVLETGRGSVSLLQRRLEVGYGRASRLIDQMYEAGIVGEYKGSQAREVIISKEEWQAVRSQRNREEAEEADQSGPPGAAAADDAHAD